MIYYLLLFFIVALFCYVEYSDKKTNCRNAQRLMKEFDEWVDSEGKSKRPSNALFTELYKMRYGKEQYVQDVVSKQGRFIKTDKIDVIASFPSLNINLLPAEVGFVENLESYYTNEYKKIKSFGYFIRFICSIPLKLIQYVNPDIDKTTSKLLQLLIWFFSLFLPPIKDLVLAFIEFMLSKK